VCSWVGKRFDACLRETYVATTSAGAASYPYGGDDRAPQMDFSTLALVTTVTATSTSRRSYYTGYPCGRQGTLEHAAGNGQTGLGTCLAPAAALGISRELPLTPFSDETHSGTDDRRDGIIARWPTGAGATPTTGSLAIPLNSTAGGAKAA